LLPAGAVFVNERLLLTADCHGWPHRIRLQLKHGLDLSFQFEQSWRAALLQRSDVQFTAGSGNVYVTITGTGFLPGATAFWNGSPRTTNFVDSAHLSVAVAAADVQSAAAITLTAENPGSGASNSISVTVQ
jgi:hypothetical protein